VHVVHVDLLGVRFERGVDVLVDEGENVRLLHRHHVVRIEGFGRIAAAKLLVQAQKLARRADLLFRHGVEVLAVGALEREPHGEREEITERERRLVERLPEHLREVRGEGRLRTLEALERLVELGARLFVVLRETLTHALERVGRDRGVGGHGANGRTSNPQDAVNLARPLAWTRRLRPLSFAGRHFPRSRRRLRPDLAEIAQENSPSPTGKFPRAARRALPAIAALCVIFGALFLPWLEVRSGGPDRVLGGVTLAGVTIARHTRAELDADIAAYARSLAAPSRKLAVTLAGKRFELAPNDIGLGLDAARTRERALGVGREGGFMPRVLGYWRRKSTPVDVRGVAVLDRKLFGERLETWEAAALGDRPFAGGIAVTNGDVKELPPKAGRRVARADAERALLAAFVATAPDDVTLPLESAPAPLPPDAAHAAATEARGLLAGPLTLRSSEPVASVTLAPAELGTVLATERTDTGLRLVFGAEPLAKLFEPVRKSVELEPANAKFDVSPAGVVSVVPGRPGLRVELDRVPDALRAAVNDANRTGDLPLARRPDPTLTTAQAEALGVKGLVSSFTTRHPCCEKRVSNIHRIADILDGTVVLPGETVSVNALVGPRTLKAGFVPAPTIEEGEMVDSIGGGISQFATTLFNALFHGGYDIIERQPHTYWFPRYPMGHEATLSWPKPDIIFKNDTSAGLLIKTSYTDTSITVKLYGDNGGRKVRAEVSERQNIVPAPLEIIPNPRVSPDEEHVSQPGSIGWSVIVSRILTFPDGTKKEEKRRVTYKARTRRIEVNPCRIPEGEKGYTGVPCPVPANTDEGSANP